MSLTQLAKEEKPIVKENITLVVTDHDQETGKDVQEVSQKQVSKDEYIEEEKMETKKLLEVKEEDEIILCLNTEKQKGVMVSTANKKESPLKS